MKIKQGELELTPKELVELMSLSEEDEGKCCIPNMVRRKRRRKAKDNKGFDLDKDGKIVKVNMPKRKPGRPRNGD